ncbi:MAG TPA: hypothetical protein VN578_09635 [Candidatus Binatia bacterium]|nr:hypothetical protein [Candidatus Binatia bacterium]
MKTNLRISLLLWRKLMAELKRRGAGVRESGAFLLGNVGGCKIKHFIPYDDLDPTALDTGIISFQGECFVPLWNYCQRHKMQVLADVHTHGGKWTGQSVTDQTNPMIETPGHVALIVPNFAKGNRASLKGVGVYEYLGDHEWRTYSAKSGRVKLPVL